MLLFLTLSILHAQLPSFSVELNAGRDTQVQFERRMYFDGRACSVDYRVTRADGSTAREEDPPLPAHCEAMWQTAWMRMFLKHDCRGSVETHKLLFSRFLVDESCTCLYRQEYPTSGMDQRLTIPTEPSYCEKLYTPEQWAAWEIARGVIEALTPRLP